jgi:hypothetical protein
VYQPQIEDWTGNSFAARAAIAITENSSKQPLYGVLWFTARAEIDKINRLVTLSDFKVKKISIPLAPEKAAAIEVALQARRQAGRSDLARPAARGHGHQPRNDNQRELRS